MSLAEDLQLIALHAVVADTEEYRLRYIQRWYSSTFHTPLHIVKELPLSDILLAFWESKYEKMDDDDLQSERLVLTETPEARMTRIAAEEKRKNEDEAFARYQEEQAQKTPRKIDDMGLAAPEPIRTRNSMPEPSLPDSKVSVEPLPQDVKINFNTDFFNELMDRDSIPSSDDED